MSVDKFYHIGFGQNDIRESKPIFALLSGDPERAQQIAQNTEGVVFEKMLSENRGLNSYLAHLSCGLPFISATSGMGAPSLSIVLNELYQVGIRKVIRVGTSGAIQSDINPGSVVITKAALCRQGAANDIAPIEYPAAANPFMTVALTQAAQLLEIPWHCGITASTDTFFEGQERIDISANKYLIRSLQGITKEFRHLNILNYEMEAGALFKIASVYGFAAGCICSVLANRHQCEMPLLDVKEKAVKDAISIALKAMEIFEQNYSQEIYWR